MGYRFNGEVSTETHSVEYVAKHFMAWREKMKNADITRKRVAAKRAAESADQVDEKIADTEDGKKVLAALAQKPERSGRRYSNRNGDLRGLAFEEYKAGVSAGDVAKKFDISYANAHYYLRAFRKGSK